MILKTIALCLACAVVLHAQTPAATGRFKDLDSLTWRAAGAGVEMAVVDGNPQSSGDFTMAMRFKAGGLIPPHFHPGETRLQVISGEIRVGFADEADTASARVVKAGGFAAVPAGAHHFESGRTDALVFLTRPGPLRTTMVKK